MKLRKRILSIFTAIVFSAMLVNLPIITNAIAEADEVTTAVSSAFSVKKDIEENEFDVSSDLAEDYTITFADYTSADAEVCMWASDRTDLFGGFKSVTGLTYVFKSAGIYAVQYRFLNNGFYTYSDQFFVRVNNSTEDIVLKQTLSSTAKTGSVVKVPQTTDATINVAVFDCYGNEIPVTEKEGFKQFTNSKNILGTYYIQYSKTVKIGGEDKTAYKYLTVKFGDNFNEPTLTDVVKEYAFSYGADVADLVKTGYVYMFKNYDFTKIKVVDESKQDVTTATVKYWIKSSDNTEVKFSVNNGDDVLCLKDLSKITKQNWTGESYNLTISCDEFGLKEELVITEKINFDAITFNYIDGINKYELLGDDYDFSSGLTLTLAKGYATEFLEIFNLGTRNFVLKLYDDSKNEIAGTTEEVDGKNVTTYTFNVGTEQEYSIVLTESLIKFNNFKTAVDENLYYKLNVSIEQSYNINGNEGTYNKQFDVRLSKESNDVQAPQDITIENYEKMVNAEIGETTAKFILPSVTAKDYDNDANETSGVVVSIKINDEIDFAHNIGEEIELNKSINKIVYKLTDSVGNSTEITIYVNLNTSETVAPIISISSPVLSETNGKYTINLGAGTGVENAKLYEVGKVPVSVLFDGQIATFDANLEKFVLVLSKDNGYAVTYVGICPESAKMGASDLPELYENYVNNNATTKALYTGKKLSVVLGDTCLWYGNSSFKIESDNGLYNIQNGNIIQFLRIGTYTITGADNKSATVVVNRPTSVNIVSDEQIKLVAKQNQEIQLVKPVLENYFGYTLRQIIKTSDGKIVEPVADGKLKLDKVDQYTIENTFNYAETSISNSVVVSSGVVVKPVITITSELKNETWNGEKIRYCLSDAVAVDKMGNSIDVSVSVEDANGNRLEVVTEDGKNYVEITTAGIYTVYYQAIDADGVKQVESVNFAVTYPEELENNQLTTGQIVAIVLGSVAGVALICLVVILVVKSKKKQNKFINKSKQEKKQQKKEEKGVELLTIAEGKDGKVWIVKRNNQIVLKAKTKDEAIEYATAERKDSSVKIKIYNQKGRMIDSI